MTIGVYSVLNKDTGKRYVGSSRVSIERRWNVHKCKLRKNTHHSKRLQNSWNSHGADSFLFQVLEECLPSECQAREQYWIDNFQAYEAGYNATPKAFSREGSRHTEETLALIKHKQHLAAWRPTAEQIEASVRGHKGFRHSEQTKQKIRLKKTGVAGRVWTESSKKKLSETNTGKKRPMISKALSKRVTAVNIDTGEVLFFCSTKAAVDAGFTSGAVSRACRRHKDYPRGIHKGYRWDYVDTQTEESDNIKGAGPE